jgi:hypothetical protein
MMTSLTQLRDPEFAQAVQRAQDMQFPGIDQAVSYPFLPITRAAAAVWYAHSATIAEQSCTDTSILHAQCNLRDITDLDSATINAIHIACNCNYLRWNNLSYEPNSYLNKAASIVALLRGRLGDEQFVVGTGMKYRDPYVTYAYDQGITKTPKIEFLQYLVTQYELILLLYRARELEDAWWVDN